jgi:LuxR family transcriptional regulator
MLGHLEKLVAADSVEEIWSLHVARMARFGFDRLLYGFTRYRRGVHLGNPDDQIVLTNHDRAYVDAFLHSNMYLHAPMVKWAAAHEGACSWSVVGRARAAGTLSEAELRVLELNQRFDVHAGYSIGFRDPSVRAKGAIGLCAASGVSQAEVDALWAKHGREIMVCNAIAHQRITALPFAAARSTLTARQREVLEWVGEGKSTSDIAAILGVTATTVEKHLRLARAALDVDTTAQAVLKASLHHQIYVSPGQGDLASMRAKVGISAVSYLREAAHNRQVP